MGVVTFLSDYGLADDFVGVCHGVIARIAPGARVIDVAHGIARHDVRTGALVLRRALPYLPAGVHLAVVDPGVGTRRRAIAVRCRTEDRQLVGPDNGLLAPAAQSLGGIAEAVDVGRSPVRLDPVSATFHGRDLFAPVAAHLALGAPLGALGEPLDPAELKVLELPHARIGPAGVVAHVLGADGYGNVTLDVEPVQLASAGLTEGGAVTAGGRRARFATTFADVDGDELLLYVDAYGAVALALNGGSALAALGLERDAEITIEAAP